MCGGGGDGRGGEEEEEEQEERGEIESEDSQALSFVDHVGGVGAGCWVPLDEREPEPSYPELNRCDESEGGESFAQLVARALHSFYNRNMSSWPKGGGGVEEHHP